jgi:hypothetical protein
MATLAERMEQKRREKQARKNQDQQASQDTIQTPPSNESVQPQIVTNTERPETKTEDIRKATPPPREASSQTPTVMMKEQIAAAGIDTSVQFIDLDLIDTEETGQVRSFFDPERIMDLAIEFSESREKQPDHPITLFQKSDGRYLLSGGESRVRAMKYAREHRTELNVEDVTAFTQVRATILQNMPVNKIERTRKQLKENLLRDDLNLAELGMAMQEFLKEYPNATHKEAAEWVGFKNSNSGRVKISNALKLMEISPQLIKQVLAQEISANKAFKIHEEQIKEAAAEKREAVLNTETKENSDSTLKKQPKKPKKSEQIAAAPKKKQTISVPLETATKLSTLINFIAQQHDLDTPALGDKPSRKDIIATINSDLLEKILEKITE